MSIGASYSFYDINQQGRLIDQFYASTTGHWLRFDNMRLRLSTNITYNDILEIFGKKRKDDQPSTDKGGIKPPSQSNKLPSPEDKIFDLLSRFSINHELGVMRFGMPGRDTMFITTHSINMVGSMQLTPNWSINFGNLGYDFRSKQLTYPDIGISRDLHCWQMGFSFQPTRNTYSFHIGVKPGPFDFLKFPYQRGRYD